MNLAHHVCGGSSTGTGSSGCSVVVVVVVVVAAAVVVADAAGAAFAVRVGVDADTDHDDDDTDLHDNELDHSDERVSPYLESRVLDSFWPYFQKSNYLLRLIMIISPMHSSQNYRKS
mmetsp:Transcript_107521/g.219448  ORF Transcript_107521/g.219448 Transcript_107521/m.219448 type:complete len:117 (+) Transcript_107521:2591-2941(+)